MHEKLAAQRTDREASITLSCRPASVSEGRRFVASTLRMWKMEELADDVVLAASELITNAMLHARSAPAVRLALHGNRVRLEVTDVSSFVPMRKPYGVEATTGRGMLLVERVATAWGVLGHGSGKVVWCEFSLRSSEGQMAVGQ